ncbi:hypothetical protein LCGC14_0583680, partial [marine sediment metagenome]
MGVAFVSAGTFVDERDFSAFISRVSTAVYGVVGAATKGAVNELTLINSQPQFDRTFGPPAPSEAVDTDGVPIGGTQMSYESKHYLTNGSSLFVMRVAGTNLATATVSIDDDGTYYAGGTNVLTFSALTPGTAANGNIGITIEAVSPTNYNVFIQENNARVEKYLNVSQSTVENAINGISTVVTVQVLDISTPPGQTLDPITAQLIAVFMAGGDDGLFGKSQGTASSPHIVDATTAATIRIRSIQEGDIGNKSTPLDQGFFVKVSDNSISTPATPLKLEGRYKSGVVAGETFLAVDKADLIIQVNNGSNFIRLEDVTTNTSEPDVTSDQEIGLEGGLTVSDVIGTQSGNIFTGLQAFKNNEAIDINILAAPGQFHRQVVQEIETIIEPPGGRADALGLLATPFDLTVAEIIDWTNGVFTPEVTVPFPPLASLNSSYTTLIFQWIRTFDSLNDTSVWTSSEGAHASIMALTDALTEPWFAPAGLIRGAPSFIEDITYSPILAEREQLQGNDGTVQNIVNPWVNFRGQGIALFGQRTTQRQATALDRINVRRLLITIEKVIASSSRFLLFDPLDPTLFRQWRMLIRPFMDSVQ